MGHFDLSGSGEPFQSEGQCEQSEEWLKKRERGPTGFCHPPFSRPLWSHRAAHGGPQESPRLKALVFPLVWSVVSHRVGTIEERGPPDH